MARTDYGAILSTVIKDTSDAIREVNGTSALIAPNAWGTNIRTMKSASDYENVLDQLIQEEVASAPVASFSDGANDIPLKELSLSINPTQSGSGDPYPAGGGKNKFNCSANYNLPINNNGVTVTLGDDGLLHFSGTCSTNFSIYGINQSYYGVVGTPIKFTVFGASETLVCVPFKNNNSTTAITTDGGTSTTLANTESDVFYLRIDLKAGTNYTGKTLGIVFSLASETITSFIPYSNIRPITGVSSVNVVNTPIPVSPLWTIDTSFNGTLNFNQMNKNNKGAQSTNGVTMTTNSDGSATFYGTNDGTGTSWLYFMDADNSHPFVENHVYLLYTGDYYNDKNVSVYAVGGSGYVIPNGKNYRFNKATSSQTGGSFVRAFVSSGKAVTGTVTVTAQLFDLTQMFGATIADYIYNLDQSEAGAGLALFRSIYPNDYYSYDTGTNELVGSREGNTYIIQLGDTYYGATLDVVSGKLVVDRVLLALKDVASGWTYQSDMGNGYYRYTYLNSLYKYSGNEICDMLPTTTLWSDYRWAFYITNTGRLYIYSDIDNVTDFRNWLTTNEPHVLLSLTTPIEIDLTHEQINSLLGQNHIWHDGNGDTSCIYSANGQLYVDQHST